MLTDELRNPSVRMETTDISARGVVLAGVGLLAFLCIAMVLLYGLFSHYAHKKAAEVPGALPMMHAYGRQLPPEPRLQDSPQRDLQEMRAEVMQELNRYRWIDRASGKLAIPIQRAIDLTAERGIPPAPVPAPNVYALPQQGDRNTGFEEREQAVSQ